MDVRKSSQAQYGQDRAAVGRNEAQSASTWIGVIMFSCQHGRTPQYLIDYCLPVSDVASRQHLLLASRRLLVVPRHRLSTYGLCCGWPDGLERFPVTSGIRTLLQTTSSACWKRFCSQRTSAISALDVSRRCALQITFTYLLTYLLFVF